MNNALVERSSHQIIFKLKHMGSETIVEDAIPLTLVQYEALRNAFKTDRFIEVNGEIINTSEIARVVKMPLPKKKLPERYMFDSDADYKQAMLDYAK